MKLIINIPDAVYKNVQDGYYCGTLYDELRNGIPLDKIIAEIELQKKGFPPSADYYKAINRVLDIINKYKAGSEDEG